MVLKKYILPYSSLWIIGTPQSKIVLLMSLRAHIFNQSLSLQYICTLFTGHPGLLKYYLRMTAISRKIVELFTIT